MANAGSEWIRSGLSPKVTSSCPADSMPMPDTASSCGASSATKGSISVSRPAISSFNSKIRRANDWTAIRVATAGSR